MKNKLYKVVLCIVIVSFALMLCIGCGAEEIKDGPHGVNFVNIYYLDLADGETSVDGYNSFFDEDTPPRIELEVGKKYDMRLWTGHECFGYSGDKTWYRKSHINGFNADRDKFDSAETDLSKTYDIVIDHDENMLSVNSELKEERKIKNKTEMITKWEVYDVVGKSVGETDVTVVVFGDASRIYTYKVTLVFTSGENGGE